ncbi:hypothetical protein [Alkalimarinus alittae]|uniref:Uncharacterized protein n=1 Tax=Alkalimarinus alittae TaxID=2961619 RepID=A0ABY6MYS7_9ALTE|nr:hypothetical protein [Alkalimarinus alittae]UZE94912.1 hypothetical protein NKI27_12620 [Alkalimarinus alittae]
MSTPSVKDHPEVSLQTKPKGLTQKICLVSAYISFVLGAISGVFMFIKVKELGSSDPISASFLASFFFFAFTGISLMLMAKANLPNLGFYKPEGKAE